jgi:Spy/CpxP family protein refolding chaperone
MNTLSLSLTMTAILVILPLLAPAQQQTSPEQAPVDSHHMDMMQGQGMGGGMDMDNMGMGMGGRADGYCAEHGRGMMGGHAEGGKGFFGQLRMLDLNPDQQAKINKIELDLRKQLWALKGNTLDPEAQLYDLYSAEKPDPKKIGAAYARIFEARRQMIETRIDAMNRASEVLTKEQLAKIKQLKKTPHYNRSFAH